MALAERVRRRGGKNKEQDSNPSLTESGTGPAEGKQGNRFAAI